MQIIPSVAENENTTKGNKWNSFPNLESGLTMNHLQMYVVRVTLK